MVLRQTALRLQQLLSHTLPFPLSTVDSHHLRLPILSRCATAKHLYEAHAFMVVRGLDRDNHLLTSFLESCRSHSNLHDYAHSVFRRQECPDLFLCNTVISILSQTSLAREAVALYGNIQRLGFRPNSYSFPSVLKAATHLGLLPLGREIHNQVIRIGLCSDAFIVTGLVRMYYSCGQIGDARQVFDEARLVHVILWNAMIAGFAKSGDVAAARDVFDRMPKRNVVSWTTIISACVHGNYLNEAVKLFWRMQFEDGIEPDEVAMLTVLSACADLGALQMGQWIHSYIERHSLCKTVPLQNALIDMYAKSGDIGRAVEVFESMRCRSIVSWTTMVVGLALHGLGVEALDVFCRMEAAKVEPNEVVFVAILSACSHAGLVETGHWYFRHMSLRYQIEPGIKHYGCMIDLLGRAGKLKEAKDLVEGMSLKPNAAIFGSLLGAASVFGDVELGEYALKHLIEEEPDNSGNYSLLSNIYATYRKWDAAANVRKLMKDNRVRKEPGGSSIEVCGVVHDFFARDCLLHSCSGSIYEILHEINRQSKVIESGFEDGERYPLVH